MAYDPKTGKDIVTPEDIIGLCRMNQFGRYSEVIGLIAFDLMKCKKSLQLFAEENRQLREEIQKLAAMGSDEVTSVEINVEEVGPQTTPIEIDVKQRF